MFYVTVNCASDKIAITVIYLNSLPASGDFCQLLISFANSLDPDPAQQNVRPDLDTNLTVCHSNCIPESMSLKKKTVIYCSQKVGDIQIIYYNIYKTNVINLKQLVLISKVISRPI